MIINLRLENNGEIEKQINTIRENLKAFVNRV